MSSKTFRVEFYPSYRYVADEILEKGVSSPRREYITAKPGEIVGELLKEDPEGRIYVFEVRDVTDKYVRR